MSLTSIGVIGSPRRLVTVSAPSSSPLWFTVTERSTLGIGRVTMPSRCTPSGVLIGREGCLTTQSITTFEPDFREFGGGTVGKNASHAREDFIGGVRLGDALGEI